MNYDLEVHVDFGGQPKLVGRLWLREKNGRETATFQYDSTWLENSRTFALAPSLSLTPGPFQSDEGTFGAFRDSAPDRWGQKLMRHRERNRAYDAKSKPRTLYSGDFLVGVDDETRVGALRFKEPGRNKPFLSQSANPVPLVIELHKLLSATNRMERGRERKGDLDLLLAPAGSLGGVRPKANVRGKDNRLYVAKFPWAQDEWSVIRWEAMSLELAESAGIAVPGWKSIPVQGNVALLLARFDRQGDNSLRVPFMSAMTALDARDHEEHSYLEIVDVLRQIAEAPAAEISQLWRRMIFNIFISNTDDHLRNHALLRGEKGWRLSPAYDMNPSPADISGGIHNLALNELDRTGSLEIALSVAGYFGLKLADAKQIASEVATAVSGWRAVASRTKIDQFEIERVSSAFKEEEIETALSYRAMVASPVRKPSSGGKQKKQKKGRKKRTASNKAL